MPPKEDLNIPVAKTFFDSVTRALAARANEQNTTTINNIENTLKPTVDYVTEASNPFVNDGRRRHPDGQSGNKDNSHQEKSTVAGCCGSSGSETSIKISNILIPIFFVKLFL